MSQILTVTELCEFLKVGRKFIYQCRQMGMPYLKLGNKLVRYDLDAVMVWLQDNKRMDERGADNDKERVNGLAEH